MAHCADTNDEAFAQAEKSMVWYPRQGAKIISETADYIHDLKQEDLGTYHYTGDARTLRESGALDEITFDYIKESAAAMVGDPDRCIEIARRYEAAGCDLLFCLLNPYDMRHEDVMHSIELFGKHVIPEFDR